MLGIPVRYLLKHPHAVTELTSDPGDTWARLCESYLGGREWRIPPFPYETDPDWERQLHALLGAEWPCPVAKDFWEVWSEVIRELEALGIQPGPESFRDWNDGDAGFVRAIWCLILHQDLRYIVETGVAHGVTSRFVLEALARNGGGHLWSIDVPPLESDWKRWVGIAVAAPLRTRWTYIKGTSRQRLPELLGKLGEVDLFVHDSLHTERNVRFELEQAWGTLKPGQRGCRRRHRCQLGFPLVHTLVPNPPRAGVRGRADTSGLQAFEQQRHVRHHRERRAAGTAKQRRWWHAATITGHRAAIKNLATHALAPTPCRRRTHTGCRTRIRT